MRILILLMALLASAGVSASDWLIDSAARAGFSRCSGLLRVLPENAVQGEPRGANPQVGSTMPNHRLLGFFINALAGEQIRHTTLAIAENRKLDCEARAVTSYVEPQSCEAFAAGRLEDKKLGTLGKGLTDVYVNPPYQLYFSDLGADQCLVTGVRRFARADDRSRCLNTRQEGTDFELCRLWRGVEKASVFTLTAGGEQVMMLTEDLARGFRLTDRSGILGEPEKEAVIEGECRSADQEGWICSLDWGEYRLFEEARF